MNRPKIYDCIIFYDENLLVNSRFEILDEVVDFFVVCESIYDHRGKNKGINFFLKNEKFKKKVRHIIIDHNFPNLNDSWAVEAYQREMLFKGIYDALPEDLIMYSDSDEIPNPHILKNYNLEKKYGIFMMDSYVYKINIHNKYETPWEGTRISKKKNMKNFTFLRKKIKKNNLSKSFWKFYIEKNITVIQNGGWHFNNLYSPDVISKKLKTFAHREYSSEEFSSIEVIKKKILNYKDLFNRNHTYEKVSINQNFPKFIMNNLELFKNFID